MARLMRHKRCPFSPCGRRWREAPDEGYVSANANARFSLAETYPSPVSIVLRTIDPPSPTRGEGYTVDVMLPELLPAQLRGLGDAIESLQREDRIRELVGAAVEDRAGQREEFLLNSLRVRK